MTTARQRRTFGLAENLSWSRVFFVKGCVCGAILIYGILSDLHAAEPAWPVVREVEAQPLRAQAKRVVEALKMVGAPLTQSSHDALQAALDEMDDAKCVAAIQTALDPLCLALVNINPESRVKVATGPAAAELVQHGWRVFLVKVHNEAGVTAPLRVTSPQAAPMQKRSTASPEPKPSISPQQATDRWLDVSLYDSQPLNKPLSGLEVEYRVLELYSRDAGRREAKLAFDVGQGTQDLGFRNEINVLFRCLPAVDVTLDIADDDGRPTTAEFVFRDDRGRVYPSRSRRLAPDFFFHDQVYRHSGEKVLLPPGKFHVSYTRGPEYRTLEREITVPDSEAHRESFRLERWIKLSDYGWYSGDHHVHAAGCAHYEAPTEGVQPVDMMRHLLGEDLNIGCVLTWGPCWYHQKQYFEGSVSKLSTPDTLMRYDVEVSGFPSSHAGHLCLLRLTEDDYPGTSRIEQWPTWDLPILKWGKSQGGVVGFAHSGWGLQTQSQEVPNYEMPRFDGIGANEFIVDTVHEACDFISAVDTPFPWEMNIWYHTLNCGFTTRISGETDFPCIYQDRVGLGRAYVKLDPKKPLNYDAWADGIRDGRSYCSDGLSHLFDFKVDGLGVGEPGEGQAASWLHPHGGPLTVTVRAAAMLDEQPNEAIRSLRLDQKPYWHVERTRIGNTRTVPVELIVNGKAIERKTIVADGKVNDLTFQFTPDRASWVAVRIFASAHTNPVFVHLGGHPILASKKSAQWCLDAVDVCWKAKLPKIRESEREAAKAAYDQAREAYREVFAEAHDD